MAGPYLVSNRFAVPIRESGRYPGRWQVMGGELYVDVGCTREIDRSQSPIPLPPSCTGAYTIADADLFHDFLQEWMSGTLVLYRGFPGCHFCMPEMTGNGVLRSEGDRDYPEFTMNDNGRGTTCWLPAADRAIAEGVSIQCTDAFTQALSLGEPIPIGFTVAIPAGSATKLPLCWLNAGEIVVRGPLYSGQYRMSTIAWLDVGQVSFRPWPPGFSNLFLPPQRPFRPGTRHAIDRWWESCQDWMAEVALVDVVIQNAANRRLAAANLRAATRNVLGQVLQLPRVG